MNQNKMLAQIVKEIPKEIKYVVKGLDDDNRLALLVVLMKNGKMTFTELKNSLDLGSSSLSAHLTLLQDGGLITNILEWKNKSYSYYTITDLAKSVLTFLFDLIVKLPNTHTGMKTDIDVVKARKTFWKRSPVLFSEKRTRAMQTVEETPDATIIQHVLTTYLPKQISTDDDKQIIVTTGTT